MPGEQTLIYWDSCVFLSYLMGYADRAPMIDAVLNEVRASRGSIRIVTSTISIAEVAFASYEKDARALDAAVEARIDAMWADTSLLTLVEYHELIGRSARSRVRKAIEEKRVIPKPPDAIHIASALSVGALEVHTYDDPLLRLSGWAQLPIVVPRTQSPELFGSAGIAVTTS